MILEVHTDPFILGAINAWGDVFGKTVSDDQAQHPYEWKAYKTWRFIPDVGLLMWWESPDEGEKTTVEDWLERKGYEVKIRSVMGQKMRVREVVKSLRGSTIKRFQNQVGKLVGTQLYVHRKYAHEVIPSEVLKFAAEALKKLKPNFKFNSVMWDRETNAVRFDEAPDFDTAREPHVGKYITIFPNGTSREGQSNNIWHHKWLWVKDDYSGFDVDKARQWSTVWLAKFPTIAKGTDSSFGSQLKQYGLTEGIRLDDINSQIFRLEAEWDLLDSQGTGHNRQIQIQKELDSLRKEKVKWEKIYSALKEVRTPIKLKELLMNEANQDEAALDFLKQMVRKGPFRGQVYLAGGAVRDMIRGETPKDLDVVVTNHGETGGMEFATWLAKQMENYKEGSNPVLFPTFGTAKVVLSGVHNGVSLDGFDVEAVFARKERYMDGSRKPLVSPGTIEDDAFRRDFTVNSMMLDLTTDQIIDITGKGREDIKAGRIRTTSNPDEIFGQDALRMFRAIRFATKYNWTIDPETIEGIRKNLNNLGNTSRERVRDELDKILKTGNPRRGFELLRDTGLLPHIAPEFQQAVGMTQNVHHTEDVFNHTLSVLQSTKPELVTRLIALFHDIGKVVTRSETPTGVHFYGHEDAGSDIVEKIMNSLKYPRELIDAVKLGVKNHMRLKQGGDDAVKLSDKALRKFKIDLGDNLEKVLDVIHADNTAHAGPSAMPNQIENVRKRLQTLDIKVKKPNLPINGDDLKALGVPQGKKIGEILSVITDKWFENPAITREEALGIAKNMMHDTP